MASIVVKLKWYPIVGALISPNTFKRHLQAEYSRSGRIVGLKVAAIMRRKIRSGGYSPNAGMTRDMKGSSKPLVDSGRLFKAITWGSFPSLSGPSVVVGVMRTSDAANVARIISEGAVITVTPKMSRMFKALHAASIGKGGALKSERANEILAKSKGEIPALNVGTTLVIPPRSFALETLKDPLVALIVEKEFSESVIRAFKKMAGISV
jgi:hypothetical protein